MNESYTITIKSPLLRPIIIMAEGRFSKKYAAQVNRAAMQIVREVNPPPTEEPR